jgi:hypothetical protein
MGDVCQVDCHSWAAITKKPKYFPRTSMPVLKLLLPQ